MMTLSRSQALMRRSPPARQINVHQHNIGFELLGKMPLIFARSSSSQGISPRCFVPMGNCHAFANWDKHGIAWQESRPASEVSSADDYSQPRASGADHSGAFP